jgi:hypothetical protein
MLNPADFWPKKKPNVEKNPHGWFAPCVAERVKSLLQPDMEVVLELGAWMGKSTRFICDQVPQAQVITIDTWAGSVEHQGSPELETLYETFVVNCWDYRQQLVPIRMTTKEGMGFLKEQGIVPRFIFIDADHSYGGVCADITQALTNWPDIIVCGDDWAYGENENPAYPVKAAALEMARRFNKRVNAHSNVWSYE